MSDGFTWMQHPDVGIAWGCPDGAVDQWVDLGHERCDAPVEINPAIAERLAIEKAAAEEAEREAERSAAKKSPKSNQKPEEN
jgi:hypothetical protein